MPQYAVILTGLDEIEHFPIISFIIFLLAPVSLEVLSPELLVIHLMYRQDSKIKRILFHQSPILRNRMHLHAEFQPRLYRDPSAINMPKLLYFCKIPRVIHIRKRFFPAVCNGMSAVPVLFDSIIHVIRKTNFIHFHRYGVLYDLFHRVYGIIAELRMHMIIRKHTISSVSKKHLPEPSVVSVSPRLVSLFIIPSFRNLNKRRRSFGTEINFYQRHGRGCQRGQSID